nr:acyltransferase [Erythrobacter sp. F6033]
MRGLAAFAVVVYHTSRPNPLGYLAVDLFFILSGFVLCHAYGGRIELVNFIRIRLIRLYPMFLAGVLVGLAIRGGNPASLLLVPDWTSERLYPMNTALWSVAYELLASIGFGLLYRFGWKAWLPFWAGSGLIWCSVLVQTGQGSLGMTWDGQEFALARLTFTFTTGIALYWLFQRYGKRIESHWAWLVCIAPVALTFWADLPLVLALTILLPACVLAGAIIELPAKRFAKLSGDISYPLYAIHLPIVALFGWISVPIVLVASFLLDRYIDRPVRRWLTAKTARLVKAA